MLQEFSSVFLYISFFGISDLIIEYLNLKTKFQRLIYYVILIIISVILYYLYNQ